MTRLDFDWVIVPAGEFLMGSDGSQDPHAFDNELPQHRLYLPTYRLARVPVTIAQFEKFIEDSGYQTTAEQRGATWNYDGSTWTEVKGGFWARPHGPESDVREKAEHPVTCVSWHDAMAFCRWAGVRLPTEAEWEKGARGPDGRIYPWGNEVPDPDRCNYGMNVGDTTPVGAYPNSASPYGLLDMAGNVREWLQTLWGQYGDLSDYRYPYDPTDGREDTTAPDEVCRVMRECCFASTFRGTRCAYRHGNSPSHCDTISGFRVANLG